MQPPSSYAGRGADCSRVGGGPLSFQLSADPAAYPPPSIVEAPMAPPSNGAEGCSCGLKTCFLGVSCFLEWVAYPFFWSGWPITVIRLHCCMFIAACACTCVCVYSVACLPVQADVAHMWCCVPASTPPVACLDGLSPLLCPLPSVADYLIAWPPFRHLPASPPKVSPTLPVWLCAYVPHVYSQWSHL